MTPRTSTTKVGAVFVNFHSGPLIAERAERLVAAGIRVVVADNSGDFDDSRIPKVDTGGNVGFGAACNRAVAALESAVEVVCFHNPDVDIEPEVIRALAERATPGTGALAPALRTGGSVRERGFHYPSPPREAYLSARAVAAGRLEPPSPMAVRRVGRGRRFGTAALLVVGREPFLSVGGFDQRYFLYAEDLDLWHRLARAGCENRFVPELVAAHVGAAGSPMNAGTRELLRWVGVELFAETHLRIGWRPFRAAHRPFLRRIPASPELLAAVTAQWHAGSPPSVVADMVRQILRQRAGVHIPAVR